METGDNGLLLDFFKPLVGAGENWGVEGKTRCSEKDEYFMENQYHICNKEISFSVKLKLYYFHEISIIYDKIFI